MWWLYKTAPLHSRLYGTYIHLGTNAESRAKRILKINGMRQCLIFGKSALWKQRSTCHCNCGGKAAESLTGFKYYYFIRQRATSPKRQKKKKKPKHQQPHSRVQWFQRREMQSCKLQRNHNFLADAQLPRGAQAPQNLQTPKGAGSTYRDTMHFAVFPPHPPFFFSLHSPTSEAALGKQGCRMVYSGLSC